MRRPLFLLLIVFLWMVRTEVSSESKTARASFAGGCFWCMEEAFENMEGVVSVTSGFSAGLEAVEIVYDNEQIDYEKLLTAFWRNIDPTDAEGQFCDRGPQYRSAIFYYDEQQRIAAEGSRQQTQKSLGTTVVTPVMPAAQFVAAGEEHQDYYRKHTSQYRRYKMRCGREERLRAIWNR